MTRLGVLFLTPPLFYLGAAGVAGTFDINIPPNAALIGSTITFQGYHLEVGPISGPAKLTQPLGLTVLPPSLLCFDPTSCA